MLQGRSKFGMRLSDFDYHLPEDLIALEPSAVRGESRLLHVQKGGTHHHQFTELPSLLKEGDLLVLNNTRVFPAALTGTRPAREGGGEVRVDLNLLYPVEVRERQVTWRAFARPAKRLKAGDHLQIGSAAEAQVVRREGGEVDLLLNLSSDDFMAAVEEEGKIPLPPYIARRRDVTSSDRERYQTVYAVHSGSVAAPTAGLHFTPTILSALERRGITTAEVTLHVGPGTFLPVSSNDISDHQMHSEWGEITPDVAASINAAKAEGRRIVSVGTTSTRLLEAAAVADGVLEPFRAATDIFITPGYKFRIVDALITNFHLPRSTLLMLISAFAGVNSVKDAYKSAVEERYRFYSYGDACLLEKDND